MYKTETKGALQALEQNKIGAGSHGDVFQLPSIPNVQNICGKYHRQGYRPHEYEMLCRAYDMSCSVPEPICEHPAMDVFLMQALNRCNLAWLLREGRRFSQAIVDEIIVDVRQFNSAFTHGALGPGKIVLHDYDTEAVIIDSGFPKIVGLYQAHTGSSTEYRQVRSWFKGRIVP